MPYGFLLSTTSVLSFIGCFESNSHPSLITAATVHREILRTVLKKHKRLPLASQASNLTVVISAILDYLPYLFALDAGLSGKSVSDEEIDVVLVKDIEVEWRPCLATGVVGRETARVRGRGLDYEMCFVLTTLAYAYTLMARVQLLTLYAATIPTPEQRTAAISNAKNHLLEANSLHTYSASKANEFAVPSAATDICSFTQSGLASLAMSEATLMVVLKDDLYPALVAQDRNNNDRDWMIKAPEIPKVRVGLFTKFSLAAGEHARVAHAHLTSSKSTRGNVAVDDSLLKYVDDLRKTSRAKACRFFGIEAELTGKTGEAIAWLDAGKKELGFKTSEEEGSKTKVLAKFKKNWAERKEDRKIVKRAGWGNDAGRLEEARVIEMLDKKWNKENDLISSQRIPPSEPLRATLSSGRNIHIQKTFVPPSLDADTVARMRAPPESGDEAATLVGDSDDSENENVRGGVVPGTFPSSFGGSVV
ncbi:hypothetical protein MMC34_000053 [Xylographa carneopallida]|nr:hypothetical protein [Xylographa carneopallida]